MPKIMFRPNPTPPPFVPPVPPTPDYPFPVAGSAVLSPASWQVGDYVQCTITPDASILVEGWKLYGFKDGQWQDTDFLSDGSTSQSFLFEEAPFNSTEYENYCVVGLNVTPSVPSINVCFPISN